MLKFWLHTAAFATALAVGGAGFAPSALAEIVYNRGAASSVESLDPHKSSSVNDRDTLVDIFVGLATPDAAGVPIPGAAESWTVSEDGTVYTFKLRPDGAWSDGSPVTADDFVYSWRRVQNPATGARYASLFYAVKNAEEINTGKLPPEELGVRAIDPGTFEITLKQPVPYFIELLMHPGAFPVPGKVIEKFGDDWTKPGNMVTNGAYTVTKLIPNDRVELTKNARFYDAANVAIDVVNYIPIEDRATGIRRFEAAELDSYGDLPVEQLATLRVKFGDQIRITPTLASYFYSFKNDKAPWDNPKLRYAISMGIDREFIAEKVWSGAVTPAYSFVPPGSVKGYTPGKAAFADMSMIDREDEAKKIISELGYGPSNPLKLEIRYNTSENHKNTAVAIQEQLRPLGVEVSLFNVDYNTHYAHLQSGGDFDLARDYWMAPYGDPEGLLNAALSTSPINYSHFRNEKYDSLLSQAASETDPAKRFDLLSQAESILMNEAGIIPYIHNNSKRIVSTRLRGWVDNASAINASRFLSKQ